MDLDDPAGPPGSRETRRARIAGAALLGGVAGAVAWGLSGRPVLGLVLALAGAVAGWLLAPRAMHAMHDGLF